MLHSEDTLESPTPFKWGPIPPTANITHPALHIRDVNDVLVILEAVRRGILPLITFRLSESERGQLRSGNIFVWQESAHGGGLVRWTDGRKWSQSKVCAECLFYEEKVEISQEERVAKSMRRLQRICNPGTIIPPPARNQRPSKAGGLTKRTYSFYVRLPGSRKARKWHAVAYNLSPEGASLPVIDDYPELRDIRVPAGVFIQSNCKGDTTPAFFATPLAAEWNAVPATGVRIVTDATPLLRLHVRAPPPYYHFPAKGARLASIRHGCDDRTGLILPPISRLFLPWAQSATNIASKGPSDLQDPVSQQDRRTLNSFRLQL
ncbi:Gti1/Pac2 family-domain-containing protein [Mycena pura]|uniref:Gti1/Pac2 family-domain-containing protein n=1 Tax=Mycena pura TaxID=153505 RepID=A0AAD6UM85_9AGAR|nr:Gti1/Pac2 family-domain-containing protein [Mycena pura]